MLTAAQLQQLAEEALTHAKKLGATQCAVRLGCDKGLQVRVRLGKLDQLEHHNGHSGSIEVYRGKARASVSTNQLDRDSLLQATEQAYAAAEHAATDEYAGLAEPGEWAREFRDFFTYHPHPLDPDEALGKAMACEEQALATDSRLVNSEGAECSGGETLDCLALYDAASGETFHQTERGTSFSLGCALIGQGKDQQQVGYWFDQNTDFRRLLDPGAIAARAAQNTLERLDAKSVTSGSFPVLFDAQMARKFWRMLLSGISGGALYRKASVLYNKLETPVFPDWLTLTEEPHIPGYQGSSNYDAEGVATRPKKIVDAGVLSSYLLDSYSARKLNRHTTANAGGISNVLVAAPQKSFDELIRQMGTGLIVRETMGNGLNMITGDYSVGASGCWVENGELAHPVQVATISGNLLQMFSGLVATGKDIDTRFALRTGSLLLGEMHLGGSEGA